MNHDEHDELWNLLGKARAPKERPFFSAKVLRAIREDDSREAAGVKGRLADLWVALRRRWVFSLASCSAVALAVFLAVAPHTPQRTTTSTTPTGRDLIIEGLSQNDPDELAASLDNLLATQDNALWLQADPSSLY